MVGLVLLEGLSVCILVASSVQSEKSWSDVIIKHGLFMLIEVFGDERFFSIADTDSRIVLSLNDNTAFYDWTSTNLNHVCIINGPCKSHLFTLIQMVMFRTDRNDQLFIRHRLIVIFTMYYVLYFLFIILKRETVLISIIIIIITYLVIVDLNCGVYIVAVINIVVLLDDRNIGCLIWIRGWLLWDHCLGWIDALLVVMLGILSCGAVVLYLKLVALRLAWLLMMQLVIMHVLLWSCSTFHFDISACFDYSEYVSVGWDSLVCFIFKDGWRD